jgi:MHS family proline/betaine transporter-like MFS transporter
MTDNSERSGGPPQARGRTRRTALLAGAIGNVVEWYDFAIYGFTATTIATLFFPEGDRTAALLATFAIFGVTFFVRPIGGLFWGHVGDKAGRRNALAAVVLLMGGATMLIGFLPTFAQVGLLAPALLLACRLVQGFSAGGESPNSIAFAVEYAPPGRRGLWGSIIATSAVLPVALAALTVLLLASTLSEAAYASWGWRVPFLLGGPLSVVGLYLRLRMEDTPAFNELEQNQRKVEGIPVTEAFREHLGGMALVFAVCSFTALGNYTLFSYFVPYLTENVGLAQSAALLSNVAAVALMVALGPVWGLASDRIGRKPIMLLACGLVALGAVPAFVLAGSGGLVAAFLGQALLAVGLSFGLPLYSSVQSELFPTRVRVTAAAVSYNLAYALFGGTAAFVGTYLVSRTGSDVAPAVYLVAMAAIVFLVSLLWLPETRGRALLKDEDRGGRQLDAEPSRVS